MLRIPRQYALQVAPVALITILLPASTFWESVDHHQGFSFAIQLGLLSAWLWLQWPRKRLAYATFLIAVCTFCLVPAMLTGLHAMETGELRFEGPLCDCWIAILVSTSLAIAARLVLPWRLVDAQSNDDASGEVSARGSLFDLIVAVSACAGAFALIRYRLTNDFPHWRPHPIQPSILAAISTIASVTFLRLFAPLKIGLQLLVFVLAAPLVAGAAWVALNAVATLAEFDGDLLANAIAPPTCAAIFASVASLCGLRFGGFEIRGLGRDVGRLVTTVVCLSAVGGVMIWINLIPYGTQVGDAAGLVGWPIPQAMTAPTWRFASLLGNIAFGIAITVSFGFGIACLGGTLLNRRADSHRDTVPILARAWTWSVAALVCTLVLIGVSIANVRSLMADGGFEKRPYADKLWLARTPYSLHPIDQLTASAARSLGHDVPGEVITDVSIVESLEATDLEEICSLPELQTLEISEDVQALPAESAWSLVRSNRLESLVLECPELGSSALDAITSIASLELLVVAATLPDVPISFGQQTRFLDVDLRENSHPITFPNWMKELLIKVSDKTDLSELDNTYRINTLVLNSSQRTSPIELRTDDLDRVVLHHGDHDLSLSLKGSSLFSVYFVALRDPELPAINPREPHINIEFSGRYDGNRLEFRNASCFFKVPQLKFNDLVALNLKETNDVSLAQQLKALSADRKWSLELSGRIDREACEQLARLSNLYELTIACPPQSGGIPFDVIAKDTFPNLLSIGLSGAAITQKQFDGLMGAATRLGTIELDGSHVTSIDLRNHPDLTWLAAINSPGLNEVRFGSELPTGFVVTNQVSDLEDYVIKGKGFNRHVLNRIFLETNARMVKVEDTSLDEKAWRGLDFGPNLESLELAEFPPPDLYKSWAFGDQFVSLTVNSRDELPADLLPMLFKNSNKNLFVDLGVVPAFPTSSEGHTLSLVGRKISDEMIVAITTIKTLRELNLYGTGITVTQLNAVRRRCPWITTIHTDTL
ncbi:MAG: hypothetical protein F9B45_05110 [Phycisphaera sp. RhM]|nr:hypothetical protein [Phycisphaera sp. RhM]